MPTSTRATDAYGGSADKRNRFVLEVARATVAAIGAGRVGIRLSPYGVFNGTGAFDGVEEQYLALARELGALKLAYLHLVDHSSMGAPEVPAAFKAGAALRLRRHLHRLGRPRPRQRRTGAEGGPRRPGGLRPRLAREPGPDRAHGGRPGAERARIPPTFYTPGAKGYTDYPRAEALKAVATA